MAVLQLDGRETLKSVFIGSRVMNRSWLGPVLTVTILGAIGLVLYLNLETRQPSARPPQTIPDAPTLNLGEFKVLPNSKPKGFREYPIGDEVEKNYLKIAAVWLPAVAMDGSGLGGTDIIHVEADVQATEGNPNGFGLGEFVPYLKINYSVIPAEGGDPIQKGTLIPMVAADGLHYGASLAMPKSGEYRLVYDIQPPSTGGLGRHSDPATGVAPFWEPFQVVFDWDYPGPPQ